MPKSKMFPERKMQKKRKQNSYYEDNYTSHRRRVRMAKEAAGNCWWIETFLKMYPNIIKK